MLTMMRWHALQEQDLYVKGQGHTWKLKHKTGINTSSLVCNLITDWWIKNTVAEMFPKQRHHVGLLIQILRSKVRIMVGKEKNGYMEAF